MDDLVATREELVAELLRARFALEAGNLAVWDVDLSAGECHWSDAFETLQGRRPGTLGPSLEAWLAHVHHDDRSAVRDAVATAVKVGTDFSVCSRSLEDSQPVRWIESMGRIVRDRQGTPLQLLGVSADVTERCRLEEQARQDHAMATIGQQARGVAHDLNNLLMVILGESEMAESDLPPGAPGRESLEEIQRAGRRATELTKQLSAKPAS